MVQISQESSTLLNAEIGFLDTRLALIHIPRKAYLHFVHPILQLLLHNDQCGQDGAIVAPNKPWNYWHPFVNVSLTPNECSVVCPRHHADAIFAPLVNGLHPDLAKTISITHDDYSVIVIGGEGLDAGQRVLDLTSPLALAGIPIFFITSYYSDFILVPLSARDRVIHALEERGFVFVAEDDERSSSAGHMTNPASPLANPRPRGGSASSWDFQQPLVSTPPPTSIPELQEKTFRLLRRNDISPTVNRCISLVTCAGIKDSTPSHSVTHFTDGKLQLGLARCLTLVPPPQFFSVTLTDGESASLTMEKRLLRLFPYAGEDVLLGHQGPEQVAITLDLQHLPLESAGIVAGVASRLTEGMQRRMFLRGPDGPEVFNMSYLSTSRAGHVIVYEDELDDALDALQGAQQNGIGAHEHRY